MSPDVTVLNESELIISFKFGTYMCSGCGWTGYPLITKMKKEEEENPDRWLLVCRSCERSETLVRIS